MLLVVFSRPAVITFSVDIALRIGNLSDTFVGAAFDDCVVILIVFDLNRFAALSKCVTVPSVFC